MKRNLSQNLESNYLNRRSHQKIVKCLYAPQNNNVNFGSILLMTIFTYCLFCCFNIELDAVLRLHLKMRLQNNYQLLPNRFCYICGNAKFVLNKY